MTGPSRLIRYCPSSELLNLMFGLLTAASINITTSIALDSSKHGWQSWVVAVALLIGAAGVGSLAIVVGRVKEDTLAELGPTFSAKERRAEVQASLHERRYVIGTLEALVTAAVVISVIVGLS